jgi:hypothetical protein
MEPVSECVQLVSAYVEAHAWNFGIMAVLAVVGGLSIVDYSLRLLVGLGEWVYARYKRTREEV